jgi:large subunit ribosomal protein L25
VCSADHIPDSIDVDISGLEINYSKHLNDVPLPPELRVVGKLDQTLVTIVPPSGYAEEMKAAAEAAAVAAASAAAAAAAGITEGAAAAGAPGAAPGAAAAAPAGDKKAPEKK